MKNNDANIKAFNRLKKLDGKEVILLGALQTKANIGLLDNLEENITTTKVNLHGLQITKFETTAIIKAYTDSIVFKICEGLPWIYMSKEFISNLGYGEEIVVKYETKTDSHYLETRQIEMSDTLS